MEITSTMLDQFVLAELTFMSGKKLTTRSSLNTLSSVAESNGLNMYRVYCRARTFFNRKEVIKTMEELKQHNIPKDQLVEQTFSRHRLPYLEKNFKMS